MAAASEENTPGLIKDSSEGEEEQEKLLLDHGANVNQILNGRGALVTAASRGEKDSVQLMLDHGADVDKTDISGNTALMVAASEGHEEIVQLLVNRRANVNTQNTYGETALAAAAYKGHTATVQMLLEHATNDSRINALLGAASRGHESTVQSLLEYDADWGADYVIEDSTLEESEARLWIVPKHKDVGNPYLRFILTAKGNNAHAAAFQMLADCQSITIPDVVLSYAVIGRQGGLVQVLLGFDVVNKSIALSLAAHLGQQEMVQLLLHSGTDVNKAYANGDFALRRAAWEGHQGIVRLLLDKGAEVNRADDNGDTALMRAAAEGHEKTVEILLDRGASAQQKDTAGSTALFFVAYNGNERIGKLLLDYDADATVVCDFMSAIALAAEYGRESMVKLLLGHCGTGYRSEALVAAARKGHGSIVEALLNEGADTRCEVVELGTWMLVLRIPRDDGYDYAGMFRLLDFDDETRRMLVNCDTDIIAPDVALAYAILRGHKSVVKVLLKYNLKKPLAIATQLGGKRIEEILLSVEARRRT
jgi:ankyrin repeat protein